MSMKYTVNVARQVYRDVQESVFYKKELDTYPENIEKFIINLESLIYDKLSEFPFTGVGLIVCYHIYDRNRLKEYLYKHTRFDSPSSSRTGAGILFSTDTTTMLRLTSQIRFI